MPKHLGFALKMAEQRRYYERHNVQDDIIRNKALVEKIKANLS